MKQLKLFNENFKREFGGELARGKRKSQRPLNIKQPLHLVLRADTQKPIFLTPQKKINITIQKFAAIFNIKLYESSVNATHIHLLIKFPDRESYTRFVRAVSGQLAQHLNFNWLHTPFTRIVTWGSDLKRVTLYIIKNQKEAWGMISYRPRANAPPKTCTWRH